MNDLCNMAGRNVLITGASSGIGAQFGRTMARAGASVVLAARRKENLDRLRDEIVSDGGVALAVSMDVSDERSIIDAFDAAEGELGPLDGVIANAGRNADGNSLELEIGEFDALMAVNLRGVFLTAREGARRMIKHLEPKDRRGRVLIVSSITARSVTPGIAAYSASKAAVSHMGRVMALEWAKAGINVNMILPGYIETELTADSFATPAGKMFLSTFPRARLLDVEELDSIATFLCSDASRAVTGSEFAIDEGQSL